MPTPDPDETALGGWLLVRRRLAYERGLVTAIWLGALAVTVGTVAAVASTFTDLLEPATVWRTGTWIATGGAALTATAVALSVPLESLRRHKADQRSGSRYEKRRNWTRLKSGSVLLNLLIGLAVIELGVALLSLIRGQVVTLPAAFSVERVTYVILLAVGLDIAYTHRIALETERETPTIGGIEAAFVALGLMAAIAFAGLAAFTAAGATTVPLIGPTVPADAVLFLLASLGASAATLVIVRELPTIKDLLIGEDEHRRGPYLTRRKSVLMPTMIAFALLFLVLLLVFVFELSVVGGFAEISRSLLLVGVFGFMILALAISVGVSLSLSRSEETTTLYRQLRTEKERAELTVLAISLAMAVVFAILTGSVALGHGLVGLDVAEHRWVDVLAVGVLASVGPYGFYYAHEANRVRNIEERFPDLLRDLAANRKAGLTLPNSVQIAAEGDYGELTPDVEMMAEQISWNIGFEEALERFADRVDTPLVRRACALITEANRSGGHVVDVLDAAATDAREIKTLENERRMTMSLYTAVVYIAFLVFLAVAAVLYGQFIPEVLASTGQAAQTGTSAAVGGSGPIGQLGAADLSLPDFRTFFFIAAIAQGAGNGMLAGKMQTGQILDGLRHCFVMVLLTLVTFVFLL